MNTYLQQLLTTSAFVLAGLVHCSAAAETQSLWMVGQRDNANGEFALAPKGYNQFKADGFFVVGQSDASRDWPYVQPGPVDNWAGGHPHSFAIAFGLKAQPASGQCRLVLDLLDTHSASPPRLVVEVNGQRFEKNTPPGAGDASVFGDPAKGREAIVEVAFPSEVLKAGNNELSITTASGSWMLYDSIELQCPPGAELGSVAPGTMLLGVDVPQVWLKDGERAVQPISVTLRHIGEGREATLRLDGAEPKALMLSNGVHTVELKAPAREQRQTVELNLEIAGQVAATRKFELAPPRIRNIWILPHSHVDIGYTHLQDEVVQVQISNLKTAMQLAKESANNPPGMRFKWNPEAVWSLDHFLQSATDAEREQFLKAVRAGDVGVDAMFGNMLTALCRPEELAQCFSFGARLSNLTGVPVESAAICDVPGWTWGIVPIMAQAGVKYFAIGPNHGDRVGTIHLWDNKPFYWVSQSKRERLLCWVVDNYHHLGNLDEHVQAHLTKLESIKFPYDTSFLFWVGQWPNGAVDNAPPDEKTVAKVVAWNNRYAAPRLTIGLAGEFFREFEKTHGSRVPEFSGDLTPYWEDGAGSTSRETAMNRASADRLSQSQTLFAMGDWKSYPVDQFDAAWKNVLLYSEHTWGAWCSISRPDDPFTLGQWKVKQAFALDADRQSRELLTAALPKPANQATEIDVFNTTQWERTSLATMPAELRAESVLDHDGRPVPSQRLASGEMVFLAKNVPPFGAKRFRLSTEAPQPKGSARAERSSLRTDKLQVDLDPVTGAVRSLRLAGLQQDFVDANAPVGLNDYRYLLGTDPKNAKANDPVNIRVVDAGPLVATLRVASGAPGCEKLVREIRVVDGFDHVEFINDVDRKSVREKDAVHFGYGFNVPDGRIHMETPWGVVRPNVDQLPGSCRNWFTVQRWVDISNPDFGVTWAPIDAPLMQIGGMTANLLGSVAFDLWMTNALESQTIYSWAQNNHWHTNYKVDQPGVTRFRFIIRPHHGGYKPAEAARFGVETTRPLLVASAPAGEHVQKALFKLHTNDVLIETVKPSTDGRALIIGLFGVTGKPTTAKLSWNGTEPDLWFTDLTEKPLRPANSGVEVPAYAVVYLRAELK
jgi:hypothetical protein